MGKREENAVNVRSLITCSFSIASVIGQVSNNLLTNVLAYLSIDRSDTSVADTGIQKSGRRRLSRGMCAYMWTMPGEFRGPRNSR